MDPRQQNQQFSSSNNAPQGSANFSFNGPQTDPFSAFVNTEDGPGFDSSWTGQSFAPQQPPVDRFDQGAHGWQQNSYQNSNLLPMPNYGAHSREFDQSYSRSPSTFNYPAYEPAQSFAPSGFDNALDFAQLPLDDRFDYNGTGHYGRSNETVSPQALQTYSSGPQSSPQHYRQNANQSFDSSLGVRGGSGYDQGPPSNQPLSHQDWANLSAPKSTSIYRGGFHIKPTDAFSHATDSSRLDGFIFVGNSFMPLKTSQAPVPRHKRRKSRNEVTRLLHREKGDDRWHPERGPILKKLKVAASKMSGPSATPSRSTADSGSDSSDSESEDESEYSDSELEIESEEPSPLPLARPADPNKAVEYDIIKTVWAKRRAVLSGTVIRTALTESWNIFIGVRDGWKKKTVLLQQAIEKKDTANKTAYERRVVDQRRLLESCIRLTLKHGHQSIIEKLGENPQLLVVFYQFLADRIKDADYTGSFINSILELIARCSSIDATVLAKTKMDKVLPRFVKRGDDQGKALAQKILKNAASAKTQKASSVEPASSTNAGSNGASPIKQSGVGAAESSKTRPATAKVSTGEADGKQHKTSPANKAAQPNGNPDVSKVKASSNTAKTTGFFAGLQSASKKPGTSTKARDGKLGESETKGEEAKPAPKPAFSFAATMANLQKQKETPPPKPEDIRKPETPEEKQKRIRKESRRKLRVSFKADHELVQVKEFMHDPEEELGHEDSQMRDVGDSKGEGQMLKMHKDLDLMDEDEDYEPPEEIEPMPPWTTPQAVDFSGIEESELERNYTSRGGKMEIDSPEQKVQEQRELSTLLVVYTSLSDIPSTPREPPSDAAGNRLTEEQFGPPDPLVKSREAEYRSRTSYAPPPQAMPPAGNFANILAMLHPPNQGQQPPFPPPPQHHQQPAPAAAAEAAAASSTSLQGLLAQLTANAGNQQQAPQSHVGQQPTAPNFDLQATLANIMQPSQTQQPYQSQQNFGAPQVAQGIPDIAAILAQVNGGQQPAPQAPPMQSFGFNPSPYPFAGGNDRKRQFDGEDRDEYGKGKTQRGDGGQQKRPYYGKPTLPCKFFQEGKCRKGDECTYLHE